MYTYILAIKGGKIMKRTVNIEYRGAGYDSSDKRALEEAIINVGEKRILDDLICVCSNPILSSKRSANNNERHGRQKRRENDVRRVISSY